MYLEYVYSPIGLFKIEAFQDQVMALRHVQKKAEIELGNWVTREAKNQLEAYFNGKLQEFCLPLSVKGTKLQEAVWRALCTIPYGNTSSYSEIAKMVGVPKAHRAIGSANRLNSLPIFIPCHRVIAKNGNLSGYALGVDKKSWLLTHEKTSL